MRKTVFVPLTDDLLYDHPERVLGPVIPFSQKARQAAIELAALDSKTPGFDNKTKLERTRSNPVTISKRSDGSLPQEGRFR